MIEPVTHYEAETFITTMVSYKIPLSEIAFDALRAHDHRMDNCLLNQLLEGTKATNIGIEWPCWVNFSLPGACDTPEHRGTVGRIIRKHVDACVEAEKAWHV